jgi:hypothetical protein
VRRARARVADAVDVTHANIAAGTMQLLPHLNVSYVPRRAVALTGPKAAPYDFCFIDGDHSYGGVKGDYAEFAPACSYMCARASRPAPPRPCHDVLCDTPASTPAPRPRCRCRAQCGPRRPVTPSPTAPLVRMFHDIQDTSTLHLHNFSGGVPLFWAHLTAGVGEARRAEFTDQPAEVAFPAFGLGVVGPDARGACEPELPTAQWPEWTDGTPGASSVEGTWRELCRLNRTRLCALGAQGIRDGQKKWTPRGH